jgi:hypothetical protein
MADKSWIASKPLAGCDVSPSPSGSDGTMAPDACTGYSRRSLRDKNN